MIIYNSTSNIMIDTKNVVFTKIESNTKEYMVVMYTDKTTYTIFTSKFKGECENILKKIFTHFEYDYKFLEIRKEDD